ncbi:hypothetical protein NWP13_10300 [Rhodococcus pyridinivorans]|nr:hypothetical protein [Rhodococcus pyridinivorans]
MAAVGVFGESCGFRSATVDADVFTTQRGFALPTWQEDGYDGPQVEQNLRELREVGATWVELTPTWYQEARHSSEIVRTQETVSDAGLERAITLAHEYGLKVFLKPHVDLPIPGQDSRNNISPDDRAAWFASYTAFIDHYAVIAERLGVEQFAMATELSSLTDDRAAWLQVIRTVRGSYHGTVLYAAGVDYDRVSFWDALDMIGIDAYWSLSTAPTTDVQVLKDSWQPYRDKLASMAATYGRKILFTEAGFTSQEGTTTDPSNWRISTVPNQPEQAAGYESLLSTFSGEPWWVGVYWWVWNALPDTEAEPYDFSPRGKAAESAVRRWWGT